MAFHKPFAHPLSNSTAAFSVVYHRGGQIRAIEFNPAIAISVGVIAGLLLTIYLVLTLYLVFKDDMLARVFSQQTDMQYAYEDRIAAMRAHLDKVTSRQMVDQDSIDTKIQNLLKRQAELETRQAIVTALTENAVSVSNREQISLPAIMRQSDPVTTGSFNAFAPVDNRVKTKPTPEITENRTNSVGGASGGEEMGQVPLRSSMLDGSKTDPLTSVARVATGLSAVEAGQTRVLNALERRAQVSIGRWRMVSSETGLTIGRFQPQVKSNNNAQGGPFVPLPGNGPFESRVNQVQSALVQAALIGKALNTLPLTRPLPAENAITSTFGSRSDPFLGSAAMHTGVDFRAPSGLAARATASGKIVEAGWNGGYGNMVEVDHGYGITSRYAHLSSISVAVGDTVAKGEMVGRVGSTGRSTGSHLHYEVRIDGDATDPLRFIRSGGPLSAR
jgi:murein DD-endopeptidase MepM/ murein hydrolase activator NlpD